VRKRKLAPKSSRLVGLKEAANELGIPYPSWRKVARDEALTLYKFGGRWYVSRADLEAFVERHREQLAS
jgi:excisionase family DNA binding protein